MSFTMGQVQPGMYSAFPPIPSIIFRSSRSTVPQMQKITSRLRQPAIQRVSLPCRTLPRFRPVRSHYYDLVDTEGSREYTVTVFSSRDNYITPLEKVTGDVGLEIKPGGFKKIVWSAKDELGNDFNGKVAIEVRGRVDIPFVRLDNLYKTMKRGKPHKVTWTGGTHQNILNFDLYKGDNKITSFPNIANVGYYTFMLPTAVKPAKGQKFKITDSRNKDQIVITTPFAVTRKVPLAFKAIPILIIGGAILALPKSSQGPQEIPDPSKPTF